MFDEVQSLNFALQKCFNIYSNFDIQIAIYIEARIYIYVKDKHYVKICFAFKGVLRIFITVCCS